MVPTKVKPKKQRFKENAKPLSEKKKPAVEEAPKRKKVSVPKEDKKPEKVKEKQMSTIVQSVQNEDLLEGQVLAPKETLQSEPNKSKADPPLVNKRQFDAKMRDI
jgi:hypothetical protein